MSQSTEAIQKINALIGNIRVAMLTTIDDEGDLHSCPMVTQGRGFDGNLWFWTDRVSSIAHHIKYTPSVNVMFVQDGDYVSIAGRAELVDDVDMKDALWHDDLKNCFEDGPESPDVVLIKVIAKSAYCWDTPSIVIGKAASMLRAMFTDETEPIDEAAWYRF
jgi:general stress protein 26